MVRELAGGYLIGALLFLFIVGFLVALPRRDWRQAALGPAFLIALFTEMFGIPFTIYLLSSVFGFSIGLDGSEGHLWAVLLDRLGWVPLRVGVPVLKLGGSAVVVAGLVQMGWGWWHVYRAQGALVTHGLYRRVRHPQYVGFVLVMVGFLIQWPTLITLLMFPILLAAYVRLAARKTAISHKRTVMRSAGTKRPCPAGCRDCGE